LQAHLPTPPLLVLEKSQIAIACTANQARTSVDLTIWASSKITGHLQLKLVLVVVFFILIFYVVVVVEEKRSWSLRQVSGLRACLQITVVEPLRASMREESLHCSLV
jgi:hypothetical protein